MMNLHFSEDVVAQERQKLKKAHEKAEHEKLPIRAWINKYLATKKKN